MQLGLLAALLGGLLTLFSPCSAMLLPAFFSYAFTNPTTLIARTGVFYLGLITTLVPLGVLAGTLGAFANAHRDAVVTTAAIIVITLGLVMLVNIPIPLLSRSGGMEGTFAASVYALGTVYGLAGVCAGPLLGAVLTVAAVGGNALYGGTVLLVFAAGMTLPLLALALLWARFPFVKHLVRPRGLTIGRWHNTWTGLISGTFTVAVGTLLLVTDGTTSLGGILGATKQARLESAVLHGTNSVPDLLVAGVAITIALAAWAYVRVRGRHANSHLETAAPSEPSQEHPPI
ncbi:sulfite exporter TauE/SafE family protein [Micromonospora sp. NBC_01655]|uniref:cytochrome c biogenesis CcdA family protein n=1 Tax=Micromonospora sp. NBC_01655 TaxID=2975983 RepID=UPI002258718E|nr:cytochrome c biogenesis protein CcdA [Micromonospora sp. NBC_01655]MCX4473020.1 sulfite exporter TauE/SafE family protein [Micromonospora sp. NBC_01655]